MGIHWTYDQLVRVSELKPHPKNPNTHSAAQVAAIAAMIEGNGWRAPILSAQAAEARRMFGIKNRGQAHGWNFGHWEVLRRLHRCLG